MSLPAASRAKRGRFITFEGGEGAGKSTQIKRLSQFLSDHAIAHLTTREPGGTPGAEAVRNFVLSGQAKELGAAAETLLFSAARIDHIEQRIRPSLERGLWVLCDRFSDSTRAYQGTMGNLDPELIQAFEAVTLAGLKPDLTFVLDLDPKIGLARANARRGTTAQPDRFEAETIDYHKALRETFREIVAHEPQRCHLIDASLPPQIVAEQIQAIVAPLIGANAES